MSAPPPSVTARISGLLLLLMFAALVFSSAGEAANLPKAPAPAAEVLNLADGGQLDSCDAKRIRRGSTRRLSRHNSSAPGFCELLCAGTPAVVVFPRPGVSRLRPAPEGQLPSLGLFLLNCVLRQ